jgi:hypothetical protein
MFDGDRTEPDDLLDLRLANPNEPVSVYGRVWMTVGDLRGELTTGLHERFG